MSIGKTNSLFLSFGEELATSAVQGFEAGKRGALKAMPAVTFATESQAVSRAERLGVRCAGVIAFAQTADVDAGEYSEPVVLLQLGEVPEQA